MKSVTPKNTCTVVFLFYFVLLHFAVDLLSGKPAVLSTPCINRLNALTTQTKKEYSVTTGTYGVLEMKNSNGSPKKIYLEPFKDLLPVPQIFWKIVADTNKNACVVFVVHNNPFLDRAPSKVCTDICEEYKWPSDLKNVSRGFTYCCSYPDLKSAISHVPSLDCKSVLKNFKS